MNIFVIVYKYVVKFELKLGSAKKVKYHLDSKKIIILKIINPIPEVNIIFIKSIKVKGIRSKIELNGEYTIKRKIIRGNIIPNQNPSLLAIDSFLIFLQKIAIIANKPKSRIVKNALVCASKVLFIY